MSGGSQTVCEAVLSRYKQMFAVIIKRLKNISGNEGQMAVELAVCIPVIIMVAMLMINVLSYLDACARFDRIAPDAVRIQATSSGYGGYGRLEKASRVQEVIAKSFADADNVCISVYATQTNGTNDNDNNSVLSLLPELESYTCRLQFEPLGASASFFGMHFFSITHERTYTIDPFKPGVVT
ncbi:MAG: hypothetical protein LBG97_06960 [Coriobacteriales bacterium]|jgi:hypothetical protein|nr:hypothetical protein [Coriobacteriales bacterium]